MSSLRHIAVHVEEPKPGRFVWVHSEHGGEDWQELERSDTSVSSYQRAMADGLWALQTLIPDLDRGPRKPEDDAVPKHVNPSDDGKTESSGTGKKASNEAKRSSGPYFGFGPAR